MKKIEVGSDIPEFTLADQNGKIFSISSVKGGKNLVIYFYPKDDTPGCTAEACSFRDQYKLFEEADALIIGISSQSVESHKEFAEKYNLDFTLLSDEGNKVRKLFGVPSGFMGLLPGRVTYVVDKSGKVVYIYNSQTQAKRHVIEALRILKEYAMSARTNKKNSADGESAGDLKPITLLKPSRDKGKTVLEALLKRKTTREISGRKLSPQILSDLLWAACGINRKKGPFDIPGRTAATASNSQEIDLYVAMPEGVYLYDPLLHILDPVVAGDHRTLAIGRGQAGFGDNAPVRLIFVADLFKLSHTAGYQEPGLYDPEIQKSYYYVDTGLMAGNVYLYAASHGLAAWFHNCNKPGLSEKLNLRSDQRVLFGQTVGYAAKK